MLVAGGLGWLLAGPAVRPLRRLTEQTRRLGKDTDQIEAVHGAREAEDLSDAMAQMLRRLADAQLATTNSLQAAQDFGECGPRTAHPADGDAGRSGHPAPARPVARGVRRSGAGSGPRAAAHRGDHHRAGPVGVGQLARIEDREPIDVPEMLDRVARENARPGMGVEITVEADDAGTVWGWPAGLRLAVDNLVRNAVTHGAATRVLLTAARQGESLTITVDDNGRGLPADEHEKVLGRFAGAAPRPRWFRSRPGAGGAAGGTARRGCRTVRRTARRAARPADGVHHPEQVPRRGESLAAALDHQRGDGAPAQQQQRRHQRGDHDETHPLCPGK